MWLPPDVRSALAADDEPVSNEIGGSHAGMAPKPRVGTRALGRGLGHGRRPRQHPYLGLREPPQALNPQRDTASDSRVFVPPRRISPSTPSSLRTVGVR